MCKITKVDIVTRPEKLEDLKEAMNAIGVTGMTVSHVYGCGLSKGHKEVYRGKAVEVTLNPKIKVEIVICEVPVEAVLEVPVEAVLEAAKKACSTGNIGDGKIFVYDVENAVKIRTGEQGKAAIVDNH
ncbi:MAG: glnB 3 [Firmicutes bacterium]|nr:glnB 3 [Bacillota bacterium]